MDLNYIVADPTKNITVLVTDPVPRADYAAVAGELMRTVPDAEQVGFLVPPSRPGSRLGLCMMGGEFCGNASLSAAAWAARCAGIAPGETFPVRMDVSGAAEPVECLLTACPPTQDFRPGDGCLTDSFRGRLRMPLPETVETYQEMPVVCFEGIKHMILPADRFMKNEIEARIRGAAQDLQTPALGMLLWNEEASYMTPCVYVRDTDSVVWERGCASGTASVGAWRALSRGGLTETRVRQPGGTILAGALCEDGKITELYIEGNVILRPQPAGIKEQEKEDSI